jgi:DNA-directed RNA polymerase subunit alpha
MNLISANTFPIKTSFTEVDKITSKVEIYPLNSGFGETIGNSLRRTLISSVPGFAVTKVKINNFTHEYQAVEGVVEDLQNMVLNLKGLLIKVETSDDVVNLTLNKSATGDVTAKDFKKQAGITVINPDMHICTINGKIDLNIEVEVKKGYGFYQVTDAELSSSTSLSDLHVDAYYSPVRNVAFDVAKVRVGSNTDLDKVVLTYQTNGCIDAKFAMEYALELMVDQYSKALSAFKGVATTEVEVEDNTENKPDSKVKDTKETKVAVKKVATSEPIETLGLTKTTTKSLSSMDINNTEDLIAKKAGVLEMVSTLKSKGDKEIILGILGEKESKKTK